MTRTDNTNANDMIAQMILSHTKAHKLAHNLTIYLEGGSSVELFVDEHVVCDYKFVKVLSKDDGATIVTLIRTDRIVAIVA